MKKIYQLICLIYCKIFTLLENKTYKKLAIISDSELLDKGYELIKLNESFSIKDRSTEIQDNPYLIKSILSEKQIADLIKNLFIDNDLCSIISKKTGFKYSIDYIISYKTFHIPLSKSDAEVYANKWHYDKPFSENTLKIIIPLNDIEIDGGGIEILNIHDTNLQKKNTPNISPDKVFKMINKVGKILLFLPNQCYHKAGIPKKGVYREQIMLQLNPAKDWLLNNTIQKKQHKIEPKFPVFNFFFDKKSRLQKF